MKSEKGITMVVLVITIVVMFILASVAISQVNLNTAKNYKKKMEADIDIISEKVLVFNNKYKEVPVTERSIEISGTTFNEIDLNKLDSMSLNYGKGYGENSELEKGKSDVYVINNNLRIIYLKGVSVNGTKYYEKNS